MLLSSSCPRVSQRSESVTRWRWRRGRGRPRRNETQVVAEGLFVLDGVRGSLVVKDVYQWEPRRAGARDFLLPLSLVRRGTVTTRLVGGVTKTHD